MVKLAFAVTNQERKDGIAFAGIAIAKNFQLGMILEKGQHGFRQLMLQTMNSIHPHPVFDLEGERYIILSVVWTKEGPKANVMPYWEYTSLHTKSRRGVVMPVEANGESALVREIDRRRGSS